MARTPLFTMMRRALLTAQASEVSSIAPRELTEMQAERRRLNRREFVALGLAAGAGVAASGCGLIRRPDPDVFRMRPNGLPVVIIGAGIAGLTAAYRLRQAGVPVRLLEAQERVGGRMWSQRGAFADQQVIELGGELIDTGHEAIRSLAAELGLELDDLAVEPPEISTELWYFGGALHSEEEIIEAFRPVAAAIMRDMQNVGEEITTYDPAGATQLDRMTIAEWLDRHGISGWIRTLLDVGYTTEFGLEIDQQSALNLLTMISTDPDEFLIFGESDERFHVRGGNDLITSRLGELVSDSIETGVLVEAIRSRSDGALVVSTRRGAGREEITAGHLIVTTPFTMLREIDLQIGMSAAKRRAIDTLGYGTNAKLMIGFDERVWRTRHGSNGSVLADLPFQLVWEASREQPGRAGILTNFTGGRQGITLGEGSAAEQAARVVAELESVFPGISAHRSGMNQARFHWPSFRYARGSYASYLPGQWTTVRGLEAEPVGNVHFAGEHCSLDYQGFMEGGCETGEAVAARLLEEMGLTRAVA
jgi:monoamine oxidase